MGPPQLHAPGHRHAPHVITITTTAKFTCSVNFPLTGSAHHRSRSEGTLRRFLSPLTHHHHDATVRQHQSARPSPIPHRMRDRHIDHRPNDGASPPALARIDKARHDAVGFRHGRQRPRHDGGHAPVSVMTINYGRNKLVIARHEAGHAVIARALNINIKYATLEDVNGYPQTVTESAARTNGRAISMHWSMTPSSRSQARWRSSGIVHCRRASRTARGRMAATGTMTGSCVCQLLGEAAATAFGRTSSWKASTLCWRANAPSSFSLSSIARSTRPQRWSISIGQRAAALPRR